VSALLIVVKMLNGFYLVRLANRADESQVTASVCSAFRRSARSRFSGLGFICTPIVLSAAILPSNDSEEIGTIIGAPVSRSSPIANVRWARAKEIAAWPAPNNDPLYWGCVLICAHGLILAPSLGAIAHELA
jgi:hypothetical protein